MMIPMNYEINVATQPTKNAKYGVHYCHIELGDCLPEVAKEKFRKLNEKLGDEFRLTLISVSCSSREIAGYCYATNGTEEWKDE